MNSVPQLEINLQDGVAHMERLPVTSGQPIKMRGNTGRPAARLFLVDPASVYSSF
jgi:hypothetical protein